MEWVAKRLGWYYHGKEPFDKLYTLASAREIMKRHGYTVLHSRRSNMLPLTAGGELANRLVSPIWLLNRMLARVPLLNQFATNVELIARR